MGEQTGPIAGRWTIPTTRKINRPKNPRGRGAGGGGGLPANVKLYIPFTGPNLGTTFLDESAAAHPLSRNGSAAITTAQSVTGGSSGNFSVAGSSIFTTSAAADLTIVGKFNIKFWVRFTTVAANSCYFFSQGTAAAAGCRAQIGSAGTISFVVLGNAASNKGSIAINTWYKIEIDRAADNTTRILIDDVVVHNFGAIPANQAGNQTVYLGGWVPSDGPQSGLCWVDDFTMTIG